MADAVKRNADITEELSQIEKAYKGSTIKEAIVSALDKINTNEGTARSLDGHSSSEFLTTEELNTILPLDTEPVKDSTKGIASKDLYNHLSKMSNAINVINNNSRTENNLSESIKNKLEDLNETKRQIREAIIEKGVPVSGEADSFRSYADKILAIPMITNIRVEPLEVTENGEYEAEEGYSYNPVITNVEPNIITKTITNNGKYSASNDDCDGYSEISVSISSALTSKNINADNLPATMETLKYKASDEGNDTLGYSDVTIDVSSKVKEESKLIDAEHFAEEYVYEAKDDNCYGYSKFTVSIHDTRIKFKVEFVDGDNVLYTDNEVFEGESTTYKGPAMSKEGYVFVGWNPQPINVTRDLKCVAQWETSENAHASAGSGYGDTVETRSWAEIVNDPSLVSVSDTKTIYWKPFDYGGQHFMGGKTTARCVKKRDNGTNSTWAMSINMSNYIDTTYGKSFTYINCGRDGKASVESAVGKTYTYTDNGFVGFLGAFASAIKACSGVEYKDQNSLNFISVSKKTRTIFEGILLDAMDIPVGELWLFSKNEYGYSINDGYVTRDYGNPVVAKYTQADINTYQSKGISVSGIIVDGDENNITVKYTYVPNGSARPFKYLHSYYVDSTYMSYVEQYGAKNSQGRYTDGSIGAAVLNGDITGGFPQLQIGFCL